MGWISLKETATKFGISVRRVQALFEKECIDEAYLLLMSKLPRRY